MTDIEKKVLDYIRDKGSFTAPLLQKEFHLGYKEVNDILHTLLSDDKITFEGGLTYRYSVKEEPEDKASPDALRERIGKTRKSISDYIREMEEIRKRRSEENNDDDDDEDDEEDDDDDEDEDDEEEDEEDDDKDSFLDLLEDWAEGKNTGTDLPPDKFNSSSLVDKEESLKENFRRLEISVAEDKLKQRLVRERTEGKLISTARRDIITRPAMFRRHRQPLEELKKYYIGIVCKELLIRLVLAEDGRLFVSEARAKLNIDSEYLREAKEYLSEENYIRCFARGPWEFAAAPSCQYQGEWICTAFDVTEIERIFMKIDLEYGIYVDKKFQKDLKKRKRKARRFFGPGYEIADDGDGNIVVRKRSKKKGESHPYFRYCNLRGKIFLSDMGEMSRILKLKELNENSPNTIEMTSLKPSFGIEVICRDYVNFSLYDKAFIGKKLYREMASIMNDMKRNPAKYIR